MGSESRYGAGAARQPGTGFREEPLTDCNSRYNEQVKRQNRIAKKETSSPPAVYDFFSQSDSFLPNAAKPTQVNGTGEAGQGTLVAGPRPGTDSEAGGPCRDSDIDVT